MSCFFGVLAVYAVASFYIDRHGFSGWNAYTTLGVGILLFFVVVGAVFAARAGPGDDFLVVDDQGISFIHSNRRIQRLSWAKPGFDLVLERKDASMGAYPLAVLRGSFPVLHYLTLEGYEEILSRSKARGMVAAESRSDSPGWARVKISAR